MLLLPAIDLRGGRCVRLRQGDYDQETVFDDDPVSVACRWVEEGARFLHLVDLDGAREGRPVNTEIIRQIVAESGARCQLGGGLRDETAIESALELGVERAIIGTRAAQDPDWFEAVARRYEGKLALGLDARDGKVATAGWREDTSLLAVDLARRFADVPIAAIVYTDISKDGMMSGPNFDATADLASATRSQVIASGGVTTTEDVLELRRRGIDACILGRTLYEGTIKLPDLLALLDRSPG